MEAEAETNWLRSVFPEEIWVMIGKNIVHIHDHLRLRDSSAYFRFLFKNELDRAMFSEVAKILHVQLWRYDDGYDVMLKCRLVCRHWQECVDVALENFRICHHPLLNSAEVYGTGPIRVIAEKFEDSESITSFRQRFARTHASTKRSPFAGQSVYIDYRWAQVEGENLIEPALQLFREYGHHIRHASFTLEWTNQNALPQNRKLPEMLKLLPNLQTLLLSSFSNSLQDTTLNNLELYLKTHSFPTLKHLRFLKIDEIPTSVTNALMRANPHITMLDISSRTNSLLFQENLPQLKLLSTTFENEQQYRLLESLPFVCPLKQMSLQIFQGIPTKDLFELLGNRWSVTLTELNLKFCNFREPLDMVPLQLPNLQKLSLRIICFTPLDFLLPTKSSLKTLSLEVRGRWMQNAQEGMQKALKAEKTIKFYEFCNNVLESNIWSIFRNLRSVAYFDPTFEFPAKPRVYRKFDLMIRQTENV